MLAQMRRRPPVVPARDPPVVARKAAQLPGLSRSLALAGIHTSGSAGETRGIAVSQPEDPEEREADRVADHIMRSADESCDCGGACEQCASESAGGAGLKRMTRPSSPRMHVPDGTSVRRALSSAGSRLDESERAFMERRFGSDFSDVRVHSGAEASSAAASVNARAFTVGHDVVFSTGQYTPGASSGRWLLAHELTHFVQQQPSSMQVLRSGKKRAIGGAACRGADCSPGEARLLVRSRTARAVLQRQASPNVLRHTGHWGAIDSPAVLGLWAKEAAIKKLWTGQNVRTVQEAPDKMADLVEGALPKLRAALRSENEFTGSTEARADADEALRLRWQLIRDPVLEEFLKRYTGVFSQALAHTPQGCALLTRPDEITRVRHQPFNQSAFTGHGHDMLHKGDIRGVREVLDIKGCGPLENCGVGDTDYIWFILKRDPSWIYVSNPWLDKFDWYIAGIAQEVAESTQFAAELFPRLLQIAGFSLGLSSRLAVILASEILSALGEQGVRSARGEEMQSALEILKGVGFGVLVAHFTGHLFGGHPSGDLAADLDRATEKAAGTARVEIATTDAALVERELSAGKARVVEDPDLIADGYRMEVDVVSEGQAHTWRQKFDGNWCRFSDGEICVRALSPAVETESAEAIFKLRQIPKALKAGAKAVFGVGKRLVRPIRAQALKATGPIDERLLEWARKARTDLVQAGVDWGKSNVVTAKVLADGKELWVVVDNPEWAMHAEGALIAEIEQLKATRLKVEVRQIFSERIPCGEGYAGCMRNVTQAFPEAEVFFGVTGRMTESSTTRALWVMYGLVK